MIGVSKIFLYLAAGELIAHLAGLPLPGPILGLGLMLVDFAVNGRADPDVEGVFDRVSGHFAVLFAPAGAGVLAYGAVIGSMLPVVVGAVLVGTAVTMLVTASALSFLLDRTGRFTPRVDADDSTSEEERRHESRP